MEKSEEKQTRRKENSQENRIYIWGKNIPGNSSRKKASVMEIKSGKGNAMLDSVRWILALRGGKYRDKKKTIDTYTARQVPAADPDFHETFEDTPYLIPYIAEGSRQAVIVVPGGGYCMKSMENEGTQIAERLQKSGVTAFVLWYRTNPYYQPLPLMDMQRAVRYVRCNASRYGYDRDKIGAVGFSAGGAQVGIFLNIWRGRPAEWEGYEQDRTDLEDDSLNFAGLVYPALSYRYNAGMLFASFPAEEVRNQAKREEILETYDAVKHMNSRGIPQFISYGTKDDMVSIAQIREYEELLKSSGTEYEEAVVEGAGHGYGACVNGDEITQALGEKEEKGYGWWLDRFTEWVRHCNA